MTIDELIRFFNMETILPFVHFVLKHNIEVIEGLIAVILLTAALIAIRTLGLSKQEQLGGVSPDQLEGAIKKAIEKAGIAQASPAATAIPPLHSEPEVIIQTSIAPSGTEQAATTASTATPPPTTSADSEALKLENDRLKQDLEQKLAEIEKLKNTPPVEAPPVATSGLSDEEKAALEGKVSELQNKLSEFDIISQDIADLSTFKDENQRLKTEISLLKGGGASESAAPVEKKAPKELVIDYSMTPIQQEAPAAATTDELAKQASDIMSSQASSTSAAESAIENVIDDDIIKDFAAALADKKEVPKQAPAPPTPAPEPVEMPVEMPVDLTPVETVSVPAPPAEVIPELDLMATTKKPELPYDLIEVAPVADTPVDDLMTATEIPIPEFNFDEKPDTPNPIEISAENIELPEIKMEEDINVDLEKMAQEAGSLSEVAIDGMELGLEESLDADKLAQEAEELNEELNDELNDMKLGDPFLMDEFERFIKKGK